MFAALSNYAIETALSNYIVVIGCFSFVANKVVVDVFDFVVVVVVVVVVVLGWSCCISKIKSCRHICFGTVTFCIGNN